MGERYDEFGGRQVHCGTCGGWTHVIDPSRALSPGREADSVVQAPDGSFVCVHCGTAGIAINWLSLTPIPEESAVLLEQFLRHAHEQGDGVHSNDARVLRAFWHVLGALEVEVMELQRYEEILASALRAPTDDDD